MRHRWLSRTVGGCLVLAAGVLSGCVFSQRFENLTAVREGQPTVRFVNETDFRVIAFQAGFDPLDIETNNIDPNENFKIKIEAGDELTLQPPFCYRRYDVGGETLGKLVSILGIEGIGADEVFPEIRFSDVPLGEENDEEATAGQAEPITALLGIDYDCQDTIEFRFTGSPEEGFSVDVTAFPAPEEESP